MYHIHQYLRDESAAVTVDWTVLSAAAVGMALMASTILEGGIDGLTARVDGELRTQNLSDDFVTYLSGHFEPLIAENLVNEDEAGDYFEYANTLLNSEILSNLQTGVDKMVAGTLTPEELPMLVALASVAHQRNIADDDYLNYYFGFDGSGGFFAEGFDQAISTNS